MTSGIAVSNIAWENDDEPEVLALFQELGITALEIAPPKVFTDPTAVSDADIAKYVERWGSFGVKIVSFQSLLFGHPEFQLFGDVASRAAMRDHLLAMIELGGRMGATALVFGSPKNRWVPELLDREAASAIAVEFFHSLGDESLGAGLALCIEPNPERYGCNFVTTAREGIEFIEAINHPGIRLHLDLAGMELAGDDPAESIAAAMPVLAHFHASAPDLAPVNGAGRGHEAAGRALAVDYPGLVSIEMRSVSDGEYRARISEAVSIVRANYPVGIEIGSSSR